ncbi:MAG: protein-tyrosine kinase [Lachnospiraceae bacterium]|nr:protein-tyrosine kinase [Lachnospiraceae bacterium]
METNQMMNHEDEIEIDIKGIIIDLWRKAPLIVLVGILTAMLGFGYGAFMVTPMYQSSTQMFIRTQSEASSVNALMYDMQVGTMLTQDYAVMIKSRHVLEQVIEDLELEGMTYQQLAGKISVSLPEDTRIVTIKVTDANPVNAMKIADTVRERAAEHITNVMGIEAVNVVDTANLPTSSISSGPMKYAVLGGAAGCFLMCALFVMMFILNDAIRTPDDVERKLGLSVLAVVPHNSNIKKSKKNKK